MTPPDPTRDALAASLRATLTDARYTSSRGIGIRDLPPHAIDGILPTVVDAVASLLATSRAATVEACASACLAVANRQDAMFDVPGAEAALHTQGEAMACLVLVRALAPGA